MKLRKCPNGHYYDEEKSECCPHCGEKAFQSGPTLPEELADCRIVSLLGRGAVGRVYELSRTMHYALKVIEWDDRNFHRMAIHEYKTGTLFSDCENVIRYVDYYEKDNQSFILQEFASPWWNYMGAPVITTGDVLNILLDVCRALSFIHAKGYQHFDVKPQNILTVDGKAKLGDFSHTYRFVKGKQLKHRIGTFQFMAPEMVSKGKCSGTEDIYSLGITMFVLLCGGKMPFDFTGRYPQVRQEEDKITTLFLHEDLLEIVKKQQRLLLRTAMRRLKKCGMISGL